MKLIFEALDDNKVAINEASKGDILAALLGVGFFLAVAGIEKLISKLLSSKKTAPPKTETEVVVVKRDLEKELLVIKSIATIAKNKPKMNYDNSADIYDLIKMGIYDNKTLSTYINKYKKNMVKATNDLLDIIEGEFDNVEDANTIKSKKLIDVFGDGMGNEYLFQSGTSNAFYYDHEEGVLDNLDMTYEDLIIRDIDYIYDCLRDDGLLINE